MLNVLETTKSAYITASATNKVLTISIPGKSMTIEDDDLVRDSMSLKESIETGRSLTFKGCNASCFQFKVAGVVTDLRGQYIEATIQAGDTEVIPLFKGYIDAQDNETQEDAITAFTAYDALYVVGGQNMQSWIDTLTFPISVKNFRDSLFSTLGITQETVTLVNDSLSISANVKGFLENPTALDLMRWICQLNGRFGQIGRDGQFKYRKLWMVTEGLYPGDDTFPSETTYPSYENAGDMISMAQYTDIEYQPYDTDTISKISIYDSAGINEGNYGSGSNVWSISENPIAFSVNMQQAARNLYDEVSPISHVPLINLKAIGKPWLECGDIVMSYTRKNVVRTYILQRHLTGIQALFDSIQSDCDKSMPPVKTTAATGINANRQSVIEIQADIVRMNELIATKATIQELNATKANVETLTAREATFEGLTTQNFQAVNGRVGSLEADHVSVQQLNATNARVGNLEADHVTVQQLNAVQGSIQSLSVGKLDASTFNAIAITTQNLAAQTIQGSQITGLTISAGQITSGYINADRIDVNSLKAKMLSAESLAAQSISTTKYSPYQGSLSGGTVQAGTLKIFWNNSYRTVTLNTRTIEGRSVNMLEWS